MSSALDEKFVFLFLTLPHLMKAFVHLEPSRKSCDFVSDFVVVQSAYLRVTTVVSFLVSPLIWACCCVTYGCYFVEF